MKMKHCFGKHWDHHFVNDMGHHKRRGGHHHGPHSGMMCPMLRDEFAKRFKMGMMCQRFGPPKHHGPGHHGPGHHGPGHHGPGHHGPGHHGHGHHGPKHHGPGGHGHHGFPIDRLFGPSTSSCCDHRSGPSLPPWFSHHGKQDRCRGKSRSPGPHHGPLRSRSYSPKCRSRSKSPPKKNCECQTDTVLAMCS